METYISGVTSLCNGGRQVIVAGIVVVAVELYSFKSIHVFILCRGHYIATLSSMNDDTSSSAYAPLLECLCSWGQVSDVVQIINDGLLTNLKDTLGKVVCIMVNEAYRMYIMFCQVRIVRGFVYLISRKLAFLFAYHDYGNRWIFSWNTMHEYNGNCDLFRVVSWWWLNKLETLI